MSDTLPLELFWNLSRFPQHLFYADQWGEHGWVYDPRAARYCLYDIDRKDQYDQVHAMLSRDEFIAQRLPEASAALRDWFCSFHCFPTPEEVFVVYPDSGAVRRYGLGEPSMDAAGRPEVPLMRTDIATTLRDPALQPALRAWLSALTSG
ncbi:MAG: hypothetical protein AAFV53_01760 [Myxococcota bacterium]